LFDSQVALVLLGVVLVLLAIMLGMIIKQDRAAAMEILAPPPSEGLTLAPGELSAALERTARDAWSTAISEPIAFEDWWAQRRRAGYEDLHRLSAGTLQSSWTSHRKSCLCEACMAAAKARAEQ
jgi:hypothetical protein